VDLFEYQGKQLFARFDIPVSPGEAVTDVEAAVAAADRIGYPVVVKAQVQVGGRGKAGGIKLAANAEECRTHAANIIGMDIKGHVVHVVWIEHASDISHEYYASFTLDRAAKQHFGMLSAEGGVEIETVAESNPDAIAKIHIDPVDGLTAEQCRAWVVAAALDASVTDAAVDVLLALYRFYVDGDCDLAEINPLIVTPDGRVHALDAKVSLDNNAEFRHADWSEYEATQERDSREQAAYEAGLQYVGLDGSVGIIANGAGLAMSTLDVVNQAGGTAANFLDVGGGADAKKFVSALTIIDNDPRVRSIFINIFGGITRGEEVANGIVTAIGQIELKSPIVIRLDGTNADEGRQILEPHLSDMLQMAPTMLDAARTAVGLATR
jgi:succinyl-CoA synthetase beta subunit